MTITKVSYSRTYPIDLIWEKIFVEASLSEGENVRDALYECKRTVESFHYEANKSDEKKKEVSKESLPEVKPTTVEDIYSCKDLKVLESYKLIVRSKPELQKAYDIHFKKLCNKS